MHSFRGAFCRFCREKRHADGFGAFNFATLVFLLLARHSPQAVSARAACVGCHQKYRESRDDVAGVLYLFSAKSTDRSLRLASRSPRNAARKVRILACSGTRTTDSPRARSGRLHSLVLAAPAQRGPEVVPAKATCGWFWRYLLTPKGSYTPRQPPRFCLPDDQKAPTVPAVRTARRQAIRKKNLALRPPCTIFGSALYRRRLGKLQTSLHLRPSCTIFVFIL